MKLSEVQSQILGVMRSATAQGGVGEVVYCSEWLGYLPYGAYHWVKVDGREVANGFSSNWSLADLEALVAAGHLLPGRDWVDPQDEYHREITYQLRPA